MSEIAFFKARFKSLHRPEREQVLCAMIRVNYGTPWQGDEERIKSFLSEEHHHKVCFGGLLPLISSLNPFTDEPTVNTALTEGTITRLEGEDTMRRYSAKDPEPTMTLTLPFIPPELLEETVTLAIKKN